MLILLLSLIVLTGCQPKQIFSPLPKSPSNITITKYDGHYNNVKTVILTGKEKNQLLSELNDAGKHIVPKDAVFNCGSASVETTVYRDIIVHYNENSDRLFEMNSEGCTYLNDIKDGISLNPKTMIDLNQYFK